MTLLCYIQVIDVMLPKCYLQYIQPIYRIYIYIYIYIYPWYHDINDIKSITIESVKQKTVKASDNAYHAS